MTATIFNIQRFSLFDGPGVRTVVFFKGCPLQCPWCHNPEGRSPQMQILYNADRCIGCGACRENCPEGCHSLEQGIHVYDRTRCTACGRCATACYSRALTVAGRTVTVDEVLETVLLDTAVYEESGGGLTLSGGEPLMKADFSIALLKAAKSHGLHTCVEPSGFGSSDDLTEMAKYTDLFLFDYKITGDEEHLHWCGVPQSPILQTLARLGEIGAKVTLRCPLLPMNRNSRHAEAIAQIVRSHPSITEVHLLPYHRLGISKAEQLGMRPDYDADIEDRAQIMAFLEMLLEKCNNKRPIIIK